VLLTETRTLTKIANVEVGVPDDLFIGAVSFEARCGACIERLSDSYKVKNAVLVRFKKTDQGAREPHCQQMSERLVWHTGTQKMPDILWCDKDDALDGDFKVHEYLRRLPKLPTLVTMDITTLTKQYLLVLLRTLRTHLPNASFRILYTPASYSFSHGRSRMSYGVKYVAPVPFYAGIQHPEKRDLLLLFLGYEGERAVRLWRSVEPERTIAVVSYPALRPGGHLPAITNNKTLLEMDPAVVEQRRAAAASPEQTFDLLQQVHAEYEGWNIMISALGPKVQTLGIYLFFEHHPTCLSQVLYAPAASYDEKHYTVGTEAYTLEYRLRPLAEAPTSQLGKSQPLPYMREFEDA
jgi:hypothetical protein